MNGNNPSDHQQITWRIADGKSNTKLCVRDVEALLCIKHYDPQRIAACGKAEKGQTASCEEMDG